jgi:hypothetical protein
MYKILLFSGGVYKFDLLEEFVEDAGGLVLREDHMHISRGDYFISAELQVLIIIPINELNEIHKIAREIKGNIEEIELERYREQEFFNYIYIHHLISQSNRWIHPDEIQNMEDNNLTGTMHVEDQCQGENLKQLLDAMVNLKLLESLEIDGNKVYRVKSKNRS